MDAGFVNAYVYAVQNVFKTMLGVSMTMGKPALKANRLTASDVTGMLGFVGDRKGNFSLSFTRATAGFIYKTMIGEETSVITADVVDAIGELTNIISGQFRVKIEQSGCKLSAGLPTVIVGQNIEVNFITKVPVITLPFTFDAGGVPGDLFLDFSFE